MHFLHAYFALQMPADHQERGFQHDETGELLLPPGLGQQEQGVPALLSQSRLQALCEGEDDAAAQAHVSLQENRKLRVFLVDHGLLF